MIVLLSCQVSTILICKLFSPVLHKNAFFWCGTCKKFSSGIIETPTCIWPTYYAQEAQKWEVEKRKFYLQFFMCLAEWCDKQHFMGHIRTFILGWRPIFVFFCISQIYRYWIRFMTFLIIICREAQRFSYLYYPIFLSP